MNPLNIRKITDCFRPSNLNAPEQVFDIFLCLILNFTFLTALLVNRETHREVFENQFMREVSRRAQRQNPWD